MNVKRYVNISVVSLSMDRKPRHHVIPSSGRRKIIAFNPTLYIYICIYIYIYTYINIELDFIYIFIYFDF